MALPACLCVPVYGRGSVPQRHSWFALPSMRSVQSGTGIAARGPSAGG